MNRALLELLRCPHCHARFELESPQERDGELEAGILVCPACGRRDPIERSIPRFVPQANYASSFGLQWNRFRRTQLDSYTGTTISQTRFFAQGGWTTAELSGRLVLDAGCGAGRFAEVALGAGATVVAVDYSSAVDACWTNLGPHPRLHVIQGDIYNLPFAPGTFDAVYSFGVLQHTPEVARAFAALVPMVRRGGRLAVDLYPATALNVLWPKYWLRPVTKRLTPEQLFALVTAMVRYLLPLSTAIGRLPMIGRRLRYAVPVVNYRGVLPLGDEQIREWAVLDTFDMLAPAHDHPQSVATVRRWFAENGLTDVEVYRAGLVVGRGRRPVEGA